MFVCVEFKTRYKGDKAVDYVLIAPKGESFSKSQTWHAVETLRPNGGVGEMADLMKARWSVIEPAYEAWRKGEEVPEDGTPLAAWSGASAEQAAFMRGMGIRTVEDVANMTDGTISKLPFPNKREFPRMAQAYLESRKDADLASKLADAEARMAAMEEMLLERQSEEPQKRGPGRPRKAEAA